MFKPTIYLLLIASFAFPQLISASSQNKISSDLSELNHEIELQTERLQSNPTSDLQTLMTSLHTRLRKLRIESRQNQNQEILSQIQIIKRNLKKLEKLKPPKEEIILGKSEPPQNDNCSNAYVIGDGHYIGTLDGATYDGDSDCDEKKQTVWYRYIAPANADVVATVSSSIADLIFSVHDASAGCPGDRSNEIACDDDCDLDIEITSCVKFHAQAGKEYFLRVNSWENDGGEFTLNIARPGSLSGRVTDQESALPFTDLDVEIYNSDDYLVSYAYPDSSGYYQAPNLPAGNYYANTYTYDDDYLDEEYQEITCTPRCGSHYYATPISISPGLDSGEINFTLEKGGIISGYVTSESGPLGYIRVMVFDSNGRIVVNRDTQGNSGYYETGLLQAGTYYVATREFGAYVDEVYDNISCDINCDPEKVGTPIQLLSGQSVENIDFYLERVGTISGKIVSSVDGSPITSGNAKAYDFAGHIFYGNLNSDGSYDIGGLHAGDYFVVTATWENYLNEIYPNIPCPNNCDPTTGTPIHVSSGSTTEGIDFELDPLGGITGTVYESVTLSPLADVNVIVYDSNGAYIASTDTDSFGIYMMPHLLPGNYFAQTRSFVNGYLDELYQNILCEPYCDPLSGTPIPVTLGNVTPGIDFALDRGGSISGTITSFHTGLPLTNVTLTVFNDQGYEVSEAHTDSTGHYVAGGLITGSYFAKTSNEQNHRDELYDDIPCYDDDCDPITGTPIPVIVEIDTPGIDFSLDRWAAISGRVVKKRNKEPLNDTAVLLDGPGFNDYTQTNDEGYFTFEHVLPGTYYIQTLDSSGYLNEVYDNIPCFNCQRSIGTPIHVSMGDIVTGIDFALKKGGSISGTVFSIRNGRAGIEIFDSQGIWVDLLQTDDYGHYSETGLPDGTYYVAAHDADLIAELYDNISCPGVTCNPVSGTPIHIKSGRDIAGIDFSLDLTGGISGKLVDSLNNYPIDNAQVHLFDQFGKKLPGYGYTNQYGMFHIDGLLPGNYYLVGESNQYLDELYNNISCLQENCDVTKGIPVSVFFGSITYGINWELDFGGSISGRITDSVTGELIEDANVHVYDSAGNSVGYGSTYPPGEYSVGGLPTGTYFVRADAYDMHVDELYNGLTCPFEKCDPLTGTPVSVTAGANTADINLSLDLGGAIRGSVTDAASSSRIASIPVTMFESSGQELTEDFSNYLGDYSIEGIPSGDFFAKTQVAECYGAQLYNNRSCADGNCDPASGDLVHVMAGEITERINFTIPQFPAVFCDDFEDSILSTLWTYLNGNWQEYSGALRLLSSDKKALAITNIDSAVSTIETAITINSSYAGQVSLLSWFKDHGNSIELILNDGKDRLILKQHSKGKTVAKAKATMLIEPDRQYHVKISLDDNQLRVYVDDMLNPQVTMDAAVDLPGNSAGFQAVRTPAEFEWLRIQ